MQLTLASDITRHELEQLAMALLKMAQALQPDDGGEPAGEVQEPDRGIVPSIEMMQAAQVRYKH